MVIREIKALLDAQILSGEQMLDHEVEQAFASDMMSDVLAFANPHCVLLTGLCNPQVIRTAEMLDVSCIVFVRGKVPSQEIVDLARERDIVVMTCAKRMYEACGLLYSKGLRGNCDGDD